MIDFNRQVHTTIRPATGGPRIEIVRYDRSGHYYWESDGARKRLTVKEAAAYAEDRPGVIWHENRYGGSRFDSEVRKMRAARASNVAATAPTVNGEPA